MKLILSILLCAAALTAGLEAAQPEPMPRAAAAMAPSRQVTPPATAPTYNLAFSNSIPPAPGADRFLFVVDHSSSMKKLGPAARETVASLITHGLDGRMMPGDSFGIWTVSAKPQTGVFPMQVWDKDHSFDQASLSANYLKGVPWEGRADFAGLLAALRPIVSEVRDLNIILITDGETMFKGSPADEDLNRQLKSRSKEARRTGKPILIAFATREGRMIGYRVTLAGESISLPPRPAVAAAKPAPPTAPAASVEKMASRSIIITKSTLPPLVPAEALPPARPAPAVAPTSAPTVPTATAIPPVTASPLLPATNHFAEVATNASPNTQLAAHLAPAPVAPAQIPAQVAPSKPQVPAPAPADPTNAAPTPEDTESNPPTLEKIPALEPPERPVTFRAATPSTPAPATTEAVPVPSTTSGHGETSRFATLLEKKMLVFAREPGSNQPPAPQPGPAAAARMDFWDTRLLMILGGALLIVALILLWLTLRHQRHTGDTSLISRSMDRR